MGIHKQAAGRRDSDYAVATANSASNTTIADVIGNKLDDNLGNSLFSRVDELYDQFQLERKCYPSLAAGATVVSPAGLWAYGNYGVVVPVDTILVPCHILAVAIETCTIANGVFQIALYQGVTDTLISEIRFSITGGFYGNSVFVVGSKEVPARAQVRARLACSAGAATITIGVVYIEHD